MPRATVDLNNTQRFDLKSLPEGFVLLRRMSYGQKLKRQEMAMSLDMSGVGDMAGANNAMPNLQMAQVAVAEFEFAACIVEHNLEDDKGVLLNMAVPGVVQSLSVLVGEEVAGYIDKINTFEGTEEAKN